jgi:hypothetical protein
VHRRDLAGFRSDLVTTLFRRRMPLDVIIAEISQRAFLNLWRKVKMLVCWLQTIGLTSETHRISKAYFEISALLSSFDILKVTHVDCRQLIFGR